MIVEIKQDIFKDKDIKGLAYLIQILNYKQRYALFIELGLFKETDFSKKLDFDERQEIEENYNKIITEGVAPSYFVSNHSEDFNIDEAIRFFTQPVSIVLENSLNDQYFLRAIIKYFDASKRIEEHLENGWIQFENAGGCTNVKNFIEGKLQSFNNLPKGNSDYLRCFVLLDSDKQYLSSGIKQEYIAFLNFFELNNIAQHILEKRCMENYMPDYVFDSIGSGNQELENWYSSYKHLNQEQKDFLNIGTGFSKKNPDGTSIKARTELDLKVQDLYSNVSPTNYGILNKGFNLARFKTEFPKHFEHYQVHKDSLKSRCNSDELQEIITKIRELL